MSSKARHRASQPASQPARCRECPAISAPLSWASLSPQWLWSLRQAFQVSAAAGRGPATTFLCCLALIASRIFYHLTAGRSAGSMDGGFSLPMEFYCYWTPERFFFFLSDGWFTHHLFGGGRDYMRDFIWDYVWVDSSPGIGSNVMKSIEFVMW
jgi:hypothetical protein